MLAVRVFSVVLTLTMVAVLAFGFASGGFFDEGAMLLGLAWGKVTLVDLYVGLAIFAGWVLVREGSPWEVAAWWVGLLVLGNLAAAVYLTVSAFQASNTRELLLGDTIAR